MFVNGLSLSTSTVEGGVSLTESVLFRFAQFENATIKGGLSVRNSALSYFIAQFSHIHGPLDLNHSQARCAYHINQSEIDFLVAKDAGFGMVGTPEGDISSSNPKIYVWRQTFGEAVTELLQNQEVYPIVLQKEECANKDNPYRAEFRISDSTVNSSLCISNFQ